MGEERTSQRVYLGIIESRKDASYPLGHMWMSWGDHKPIYREFRSYLPCCDHIPFPMEETQKIHDYLKKKPVPGKYIRDYRAKRIEHRGGLTYLQTKSIPLDDNQHKALVESCIIPDGQEYEKEGTYSFDTSNPSYNNCVSWVGKRINDIRDGTIDIPSPAKIKDMYEGWNTRIVE